MFRRAASARGIRHRLARSATAGIVIARGPTGSGKTTRSQALVELAGAIRIRTDVERKRLHGLTPQSRSGSALSAGLYSAAETGRTYARVASLVRTVASAGYRVIVDGTFLQRRQRDQLRAVAIELKAPLVIVDFVAPVKSCARGSRNGTTPGWTHQKRMLASWIINCSRPNHSRPTSAP